MRDKWQGWKAAVHERRTNESTESRAALFSCLKTNAFAFYLIDPLFYVYFILFFYV